MHAPVRPKSFAHVVYRSFHYKQMVEWYLLVFDAKVQHSTPAVTFIAYDDEHHRIAIVDLGFGKGATRDDRTPRGTAGVDHVAYGFGCLHDLFAKYSSLKERGIVPYWCIHHGPTVSLYYADPDGNQMEFQVDAYGSADQANAFMRGAGFAANPIGVEFNPEDMLERLRSGECEASVLVRTSHFPVSPLRGSVLG
ncbi:hypothetical protein SAMN04487926_11818 [Paraburkholderia steynii]|uniref:VOC domain-containing protein n=1 Tax=Paraburkholderia steynii TaxID=1245441 RepID=A0A7Z7BAX7_9BURK|nr:VOC family protein [Paraburkholderia steynii]SDI49709.1 hypothetical protein SAMN04487926_11818 [Paraburkholderia steynii]